MVKLVLVPVSLYPACFAIFASIPHPCIFIPSYFQDHMMQEVCTLCTQLQVEQLKPRIYHRAFLPLSHNFGCGA